MKHFSVYQNRDGDKTINTIYNYLHKHVMSNHWIRFLDYESQKQEFDKADKMLLEERLKNIEKKQN